MTETPTKPRLWRGLAALGNDVKGALFFFAAGLTVATVGIGTMARISNLPEAVAQVLERQTATERHIETITLQLATQTTLQAETAETVAELVMAWRVMCLRMEEMDKEDCLEPSRISGRPRGR